MIITLMCVLKLLPYSGNLLWEEIFANHTILLSEETFTFLLLYSQQEMHRR